MCLHPPQAYNLGRFIGRNGTDPKTVTFVSTHSSQVLRGVVQTTKEIQIIRMSRQQGAFEAHLVPAEVLTEALAKPTVRAESVLDGIFAQSVVVVEADGDRLVYQTVWETLALELRLDVHLATVGGVGGIADTCKLYRTLKIPVAVIADLDMISDPRRLRKVLDILVPEEAVDEMINLSELVMQRIKAMPPNVNPVTLRGQLKDLADSDVDWLEGSDIQVRQQLNRIANQLDRLRRLKRGGVGAFPSDISVNLQDLVNKLATHGLFLVPVGELEGWLADANIEESKENKWAWANAASYVIQQKGPQPGGVWDFVRSVGQFLATR